MKYGVEDSLTLFLRGELSLKWEPCFQRTSCWPKWLKGVNHPRQPLLLAPSRLAALHAPWVWNGLSADPVHIVQNSHRISTQRNYQAVWTKFLDYLDRNSVPHSDVWVYVVMNFLSHQFIHLGRAYRTVAAYKCALALPLWTNFGIPLSDTSLDLYMRRVFNLDPPHPTPIPTWFMDTLLEFWSVSFLSHCTLGSSSDHTEDSLLAIAYFW